MDLERFRNSPIGQLQPVRILDGDAWYEHAAFVPGPLPNEIQLSQRTWTAVIEAASALTRLDGAGHRLPNPYLLVRPALMKEAVSSSALEGTYAALEDVLQAEFLDAQDLSIETTEVRNYVLAAELGLELIKQLPICLRLVRDVHERLMRGARGDYAEAGEFRRRQNWIGPRLGTPITESLFVPPPPGDILERTLADWEDWINRDNGIPLLIKVALGHYQFETIHPFIDGNGRVGRLLAILTFVEGNQLRVPLLNISPYLEEHRDAYVDNLRLLSESGDFEQWIVFFAEAVRVQAERALTKADRLSDTRDEIITDLHHSRVKGVAIRIAEDIVGNPVITPTRAADRYGVSFQAANSAIGRLVAEGVLRETTGRPYARVFIAPRVISIINE